MLPVFLPKSLAVIVLSAVFLFLPGFQLPSGMFNPHPTEPEQQAVTTLPLPVTDDEPKPTATKALAVETTPEQTSAAVTPWESFQPIWSTAAQDKVGLTFDDGPHPQLTEEYLQVLDAHQVRATFFVIGQQVRAYPEAAKKIIDQGSEIGSHSWRHAQLTKLKTQDLHNDLAAVANEVYAATGSTVTLFRPPYGSYNDIVLYTAKQLNQRAILWNVDPRDWDKNPVPTHWQVAQQVLQQVKPGSIILLHEGYPGTLEALPIIITKLRERGLEPVPVSQLLE